MRSGKREHIRLGLLQEFYQFFLSEKGKQAIVPDNLISINPEKFFALEYLADQGWIRLRKQGRHFMAKITKQGIERLMSSKFLLL
ncbi:hypothetical protein ACFQWB_10685 [Paenibacillus thermoaerophilus]|uniref:Uncharacterized protein n=1 Tax=Paenibacillus thermoaerophilus TaxID=1215385 RepID=A0ABW2V7X3_9BACL|nr:hypothetical protein [Paenibacillus thermoaerophilus]TMV18767.1 hypothetical protein FE781_02210 [Paenibacillus thermoaerophilus]